MEKLRYILLRVKETGGVIKSRTAFTDEAEKMLKEEMMKDLHHWQNYYAGKILEVVTVDRRDV